MRGGLMKWLNIKAIKKISPGVLNDAAVCWTVEEKKVTFKSWNSWSLLLSGEAGEESPTQSVKFRKFSCTQLNQQPHKCVNTDKQHPLFAGLHSQGVIVMEIYVIIIRQKDPIWSHFSVV